MRTLCDQNDASATSKCALIYHNIGETDEALKTFKKVKVEKNYLFYIALTHKKIGNEEQSVEKLKEAYAITGMNIDSFIATQPFNDESVLSKLKDQLEHIMVN